jgi:tetratricopeptide (TPR) repeat protein
MFQLPKVVVSNKEKTLNSDKSTDNQTAVMPDAHQQNLPEELSKELIRLKKLLESEDNTQKSITFADSIAQIYKRVSQFDSAAHYLEYAVLKDPNNLAAVEKAADGYYEAFNFYGIINAEKAKEYGDIAKRYLEQLLSENPKDFKAKTKLAITQVTSSNPMKGILMLKEVIEEDPNNELALLNLGLFSMQSGQYEKAIDRFKILISVNPKNGEAKIFLGQSYAGLGKNQEARKIFEEVIKNETDSLLQMAAKEYLSQLK